MSRKKNIEFETCIKCDEPVRYRGMTVYEDRPGDGWEVVTCDNPKCERYGLLSTVMHP